MICPQIDFHNGGSLPVPGADGDATRIARMIDSQGSHIHEICVVRDSHLKGNISFASSWEWVDQDGNREKVAPGHIVQLKDLEGDIHFDLTKRPSTNCSAQRC